MNKQEIYHFLEENNIPFEITEHQAIWNMADLADVKLPYPHSDAKNLFVRDDKKRNYYLITVKGDKRVNLKEFRKTQQTRPLSFASPDDLMRLTGLIPGAVTPLGMPNNDQRDIKVFIDRDFLLPPGRIGVHPNDNTATIWLKTEDLIALLKNHGEEVQTFEL